MLSSIAIITEVVLSTLGYHLVFAMPSLMLQAVFWFTLQVLALCSLRARGWKRLVKIAAVLSGLLLLNNLSFLHAYRDRPAWICAQVVSWTPELDSYTKTPILETDVWTTATIELTPLGDVTCKWEFPPDYDRWPRHYTFNALATYPLLRR